MSERSLRTLEREFFRNFFTALAARGETRINRRDPTVPLRFFAAVEVYKAKLSERAVDDPLADLDTEERLLSILQPDPLTGTMVALNRALMELQLSDISVSNPSYESLGLLVPKATAEAMLTTLSASEAELFQRMAEQFVERDDVRLKTG